MAAIPDPSLPKLPLPFPNELVEGQKAIDEAAAVASGIDLSSRQALNKFQRLLRSDKYDSHVHTITVVVTYSVAALLGLMFLSLVVQMIVPDQWRYLSQDDTEKIEHFLFSGFVGGLVTGFWKRAGTNVEQDDDD